MLQQLSNTGSERNRKRLSLPKPIVESNLLLRHDWDIYTGVAPFTERLRRM